MHACQKNPVTSRRTNYWHAIVMTDLFTNRQLTALTTFSALVGEAQQKAEADAVAAGIVNDHIPPARRRHRRTRLWRGGGRVFGCAS